MSCWSYSEIAPALFGWFLAVVFIWRIYAMPHIIKYGYAEWNYRVAKFVYNIVTPRTKKMLRKLEQ